MTDDGTQLDNGAKSCQMIIKHDLRHWFHGRTPGVRTTVPVPQQGPSRCPHHPQWFYNHLATFGTIVKSAKGPQVGRFHNGMGPVVEWGQWCGHLVSGHGTNVSNHVL